MNYVELKTDCGTVRGLENETCLEFRGIRYAEAERFQYPKPVTHWDGTYDATAFRACAPQHRAFEDDAAVNALYHNEFRKGLSFTYGEDCLFLNIWAPKNAQKRPVILYIHGGSFTGGSANEGQISGVRFAENGIIFVACNYRLGAFGFCAHPDITAENGACGNQGLFDQTEAIRWVYANISAFGGDPNKITLMGQSAGAMSVDIHLNNPLCRDMFSGAILLSGAGLQRFFAKPLSPEKTASFWNAVIQNAGVTSMQALQKADVQTVYFAWKKACKDDKFSLLHTMPVYDGVLLKKGAFAKETIPDIPYIIGTTSDDMMPFFLERFAKKWGAQVKKSHQNKCYVYNFSRRLPGDDKGAWHSADLLYAFSTLDFNWRPFTDADRLISKQLSDALCAFAESGDPNCEAMPQWRDDYKNPMHFCENTCMKRWNTRHHLHNTLTGKGF